MEIAEVCDSNIYLYLMRTNMSLRKLVVFFLAFTLVASNLLSTGDKDNYCLDIVKYNELNYKAEYVKVIVGHGLDLTVTLINICDRGIKVSNLEILYDEISSHSHSLNSILILEETTHWLRNKEHR